MSWDGALGFLIIVYGIYRLIDYLVKSRLDARKQCCKAEADLLIIERRLAEIGEALKNYRNIDVQTRIRLRTLVEERIERLDLLVGPGDLEVAVVRMYERSQGQGN